MITAGEANRKRISVSDQANFDSATFVSVIIPCRNEENFIGKCLASFVASTYPKDRIEILVVDGMSEDKTREVVAASSQSHPFIRLLLNPKKITPAALNLGIAESVGSIVIRADAHNTYPEDYVENCVRCLHSTGADNVGGPWITEPVADTLSARLVAAVLSSPFGVGNSQFRISQKEGFVDTVPFGAFRRELFGRIGNFNERLLRNQDYDFNTRIRAAGGFIYQTPRLTTRYAPPASFGKLLHKTMRETQWHMRTVAENPRALGVRHLVPAAFVLLLLSLASLGVVHEQSRLAFEVLLSVYAVGALLFSIRAAARYGWDLLPVLPFGFFLFHASYGVSTFVGLLRLGTDPAAMAPYK